MARVYKFRGFDKIGNKGWVYGDLVHSKGISKDAKEDLFDRVMVGGYEVVLESVGKFTGLKDKNGREIYEGDIVKVDDFVYEVKYDDKKFASFVLCRKIDMFNHYFGEAVESYDVEVVGTIYEQKKK